MRISGFLFTLFFSFLTTSVVHSAEKLVWMGCGISKKAYMGEMAKVYENKTGVQFRMAGGGATKGIKLTAAGKADVGGSCRHKLLDIDGEAVADENVDMIHVGWDALAVVVNKNNAVDSITTEQLKKIFNGDITNWEQVGGPQQPIRPLVRSGKISGVGYMFRKMVMEDSNFNFPEHSAFFSSSGPLERNLEKRKSLQYGIAVTGISSAKKTDLKVLKVNGVGPTKENIANGSYPLFRPLYLTLNKNPSNSSKKFVQFVLDDDGQEIISDEGTVNLREGEKIAAIWRQKGWPL